MVMEVFSGIGASAGSALTVKVHSSPSLNSRPAMTLVPFRVVLPSAEYLLVNCSGVSSVLLVILRVPVFTSSTFTVTVFTLSLVTPLMLPVSVTV